MKTISTQSVFDDIRVELNNARAKFPCNEDILPALTEEVGELNQALIQQKHEPSKGKTHEDIYKGAVQVAVMAIRIATEGDPAFPYHPESGYRGPNWKGYVKKLAHEVPDPDWARFKAQNFDGDWYAFEYVPVEDPETKSWKAPDGKEAFLYNGPVEKNWFKTLTRL